MRLEIVHVCTIPFLPNLVTYFTLITIQCVFNVACMYYIEIAQEVTNRNTITLVHYLNSMVCCSMWISRAQNADMKIVIVLSCADHYYNFPTCIARTINLDPNTTANHIVTYSY